MTAPGKFSDRQTAAGHRLALDGANGEDVIFSEHHPEAKGVEESLQVVVRTVLARFEEMDRRGVWPAEQSLSSDFVVNMVARSLLAKDGQ